MDALHSDPLKIDKDIADLSKVLPMMLQLCMTTPFRRLQQGCWLATRWHCPASELSCARRVVKNEDEIAAAGIQFRSSEAC